VSPRFTFQGEVFEGSPERLIELQDIAGKAGTSERLRVLEWGSGLSTFMLSAAVHARLEGQLVTIDHNAEWQQAALERIPRRSRMRGLVADVNGSENTASQRLFYSTLPLDLPGPWDLIVIDGARRLECALTAAMISDESTLVVLSDYRRARYMPVLKLYNVLVDGAHYRQMQAKEYLRKPP
jgi:predicted O-methyltransferase YrrM